MIVMFALGLSGLLIIYQFEQLKAKAMARILHLNVIIGGGGDGGGGEVRETSFNVCLGGGTIPSLGLHHRT